MARSNLRKHSLDKTLLILTLILTFVGIVFIADVSAPLAQTHFSDSLYFVKQQIIWGMFGIICLVIASFVHYSFWKKIALYLFIISLFLLVLVLLPGFGNKLLGARRWINFGPLNLQPSEIVKLTLILYLAGLADSGKKTIYFLIPVALISFLIMLQPDLGTTLIVACIGIAQLFVSGTSLVYLLGAVSVASVFGFLLILFSRYRKERLIHFIEGWKDPLNSSYHVKQILFALGSGGLLGVGIGQSREKYLFLPEVATDSVFPIIAEELGFLVAGFIILILTFYILRCLKIAKRAPDKFSAVLATGISVWIGCQIFLNLGSVLAIIPLTGVPLPFFSYGGSSLTMILLGIGILLNVSKYTSDAKK
jgi:cell division protein FtsW